MQDAYFLHDYTILQEDLQVTRLIIMQENARIWTYAVHFVQFMQELHILLQDLASIYFARTCKLLHVRMP